MPESPRSETSSPVISVFGSGRVAESSGDYAMARELGAALARAGFVVATGGYSGAMAAVSRGAAEAGGRVLGVTARQYPGKTNRWLTEEVVVETWEDRLAKLIALGDGYVACTGGTGTLVELAVAWEKINKGMLPHRPLVALGSFWAPIVRHIESSEPNARGIVSPADSVSEAVELLRTGLHPSRER